MSATVDTGPGTDARRVTTPGDLLSDVVDNDVIHVFDVGEEPIRHPRKASR